MFLFVFSLEEIFFSLGKALSLRRDFKKRRRKLSPTRKEGSVSVITLSYQIQFKDSNKSIFLNLHSKVVL